jgi:hypothetical protein
MFEGLFHMAEANVVRIRLGYMRQIITHLVYSA